MQLQRHAATDGYLTQAGQQASQGLALAGIEAWLGRQGEGRQTGSGRSALGWTRGECDPLYFTLVALVSLVLSVGAGAGGRWVGFSG